MTRASDSQLAFADLEFLHQGVQLEPMLWAISMFIDAHAELVEVVRRDLLTHFNSKRVPKHDAFNRAFNRLTRRTLETINHCVVQAAVALDLEDGRQEAARCSRAW